MRFYFLFGDLIENL